jgi:hypothetical protein
LLASAGHLAESEIASPEPAVMAKYDEDLDEDELEEQEEEREDLKTALAQARRKPRYFAIIAKGVEVLAMIAQKRPIRPGTVRQLRRDKGGKQIIEGVCEGDGGSSLVFKVAGAAPKIKKSALRKFIADETGLMLKPRFQGGSS